MKYNKGFAPVLILIIVLGALAVGGGAYFVGKSSAPTNEVSDQSNYFPPVDQNYTPPTTNNNPSVTSNTNNNVTPPVTAKPSITILSPNGGEKFAPGDILSVSYTTSNIPKGTSCDLTMLGKYNGIDVGQEMNGFIVSVSGKQVVSTKILNGTLPANYKIMIDCGIVKDQSDSNFTITAQTNNLNLETYSNSKYGFSIKYPTSTQVKETSVGVVLTKGEKVFTVNVIQGLPANEFPCVSGAGRPTVSLDGVVFTSVDLSKTNQSYGWGNVGVTEYCTFYKGDKYELFTQINFPSSAEYIKDSSLVDKDAILNQILLNFKFTK